MLGVGFSSARPLLSCRCGWQEFFVGRLCGDPSGWFCWPSIADLLLTRLTEPLQQFSIAHDHVALAVLAHVGQATVLIHAQRREWCDRRRLRS